MGMGEYKKNKMENPHITNATQWTPWYKQTVFLGGELTVMRDQTEDGEIRTLAYE
jgi:hypothetical protein